MRKLILLALLASAFASCKKDTKTDDSTPAPTPTPTDNCPSSSCVTPDTVFTATGSGPYLVFKFKFDSTQARLDNFGLPATVPSTNEACSPVFNKMSAHYIELAKDDYTAVGQGKVLYKAGQTNCESDTAITFCQSIVTKEGDVFFKIPISAVDTGTYKWLRVSLAYQNYDIPYKTTSCSNTQWGTVASFIGFKTYITSTYKIKTKTVVPTETISLHPNSSAGGVYKQGYWGFESLICGAYSYTADGQAAGTTVVNPIHSTSPIPAGSCLVTGAFFSNSASSNAPLHITHNETGDVIITVSLSTNKSFEWKGVTFDGYYQPEAGEFPVDMGIRGMIPKY